jgi:ureidoglycolate hydrolase
LAETRHTIFLECDESSEAPKKIDLHGIRNHAQAPMTQSSFIPMRETVAPHVVVAPLDGNTRATPSN